MCVCEECNKHYFKYELTLDFQIKISILFSSPCPVANGRMKFLLPYNGYITHTHIYITFQCKHSFLLTLFCNLYYWMYFKKLLVHKNRSISPEYLQNVLSVI